MEKEDFFIGLYGWIYTDAISVKDGKILFTSADSVFWDKNPLKEDSKTINSIVVVETIKEGKSVFQKE